MWFGTLDGLNRYDGYEFKTYKHDAEDPNSQSSDPIRKILVDDEGAMWVGTWLAGVCRLDAYSEQFTCYRHDPDDPSSLSDDEIREVFQDREGVLWIGTQDHGLDRWDRETGQFVHYPHDPADPHSLSDTHIEVMYQDREGVLWIGTHAGGLNRFDPASALDPAVARFTYYRHDPNDPTSLGHDDVRSIYEDHTGTPWVGIWGGGLNKFDRDTGTFARYLHDPDDPQSVSDINIRPIYEDRAGTIWVGTESSGLDRFDRASGQFVHYRHDPADPSSLSHNGVYAICEDRAGDLWIGTNGGGLNRLDRESGRFTRYLHDPADPKSLSHNNVTVVHEDREGALWIGTWGGGANRLDLGSGQLTRYRHDPQDPKSLSDDNVFAIREGGKGDMWFGTGAGFSRLDRAAGQFTRYTTKQGLASNTIQGVLQDDLPPEQGGPNLWLSTTGGLSRFNLASETFKVYGVNDGLPGETFMVSAYHQGRGGEMYFGAGNGVAAFYPEQIEDNPHIPPVVITGFSLANKPVPIGGESVLQRSILETDHLTLSYLDRVLSFYTPGGSFYMNGTTRFLATVSEEEKGKTRNVCNQVGYESVALVPIRLEAQILGLIHVADPRENAVPLESVQALEGASKELGTAIQRVRAEAALQRVRDAMEQRVAERTAELAGANASLHAEIAERQRVEALLIKINRAYKALSECNQAVIHVSDESALMQEVCRILREECGYRLVWIGFAEQDEARSVRPVAQAGYQEGYLDAVNVTWAEDERGCGPTGRAIRTRRPVVNRDILENPDYAPLRAGTPRPPPFRWPAVRGTPSAR